ncbi:efflux RND transporter permease subunit [Nitrincola tapanii]|uniref:Efflux RND transporter permease subunit n=1 Tax=Nitrincola tapanii TaxID=1708751 RepID=A0A5A9W179_9GAMM|nr:efflux RND transporter permease subunit [Nitrincola tapanii]KAA0874322.1 efflux RND transporter permease subunit [Nitrincola tapanii]
MSKAPLRHGAGLAGWSIRHPVGVCMIALAVVVLGLFSLGRLSVDLLPRLIYPEIRVSVTDPGVPALVMEDRVTRYLEEQLAITEDLISIQSSSELGRSVVDLSFPYGKDIDLALRDASTRLDRARRFLPDSIEQPVIFKRDPSQIPVLEYSISSNLMDAVELRTWADDVFAKWFINLPGVAAAEVGGGLEREVQIRPDPQRLAAVGLTLDDLVDALARGNRQDPAGRLRQPNQELAGRISGRFASVEELATLPIPIGDGHSLMLAELAQVLDTHQEETLRIRANGVPGIKLSIQKQPEANTIQVANLVEQRLAWLQEQALIPPSIEILPVADQSIYVRQALNNSVLAVVSGALLAMSVVYLFLGNLRRTLIIGSAIPIAVMVTFVLMGLGGLTLNVMTLGGLALGVGMLVDNTIVMLENIYRHQRKGEASYDDAAQAAAEVNSAIVASTSTNLAAILPFLFVGGLVGLLFRELIMTITSAILASMVIALTLVPALSARVTQQRQGRFRQIFDRGLNALRRLYVALIQRILRVRWPVPLIFVLALATSAPTFFSPDQTFLPTLDDGQIQVRLVADTDITLEAMDQKVRRIEALFAEHRDVATVFTVAGGNVFGRSARETPNQATLTVQLRPLKSRALTSQQWINQMNAEIRELQLAGVQVRMRQQGIRGIRTSTSDDDISVRIQGPDLEVLDRLAREVQSRLRAVSGVQNIAYSSEEEALELDIRLDRQVAARLGVEVMDLSQALQYALEGRVVSEFFDQGRSVDIRLRLPREQVQDPQALEALLLFPRQTEPVYLHEVAEVSLIRAPGTIRRDSQMRIVEISANLMSGAALGSVLQQIDQVLADLELPEGYSRYDGGAGQVLQEGQQMTSLLLLLALFLVFVVMAVQYESLRNPLVIILSVPFSAIGVASGLNALGMPLSMPVWLGMIMLAGIVVNNAIVMVEYIELERDRGVARDAAIVHAAALRLRPILMTTLTTVAGMLPLALGLGEGSEMLQPLAVAIVFGLSFSMLVGLILVPVIYSLLHPESGSVEQAAPDSQTSV